jgi:integrase
MATFEFLNNTIIVKNLLFIGKKKTPYYQRRVPAGLEGRVGTKLIKFKLDLKLGSPATQVERISAWHDSLFAQMTNDQDLPFPAQKKAALGLLYTYGLKEGSGNAKFEGPDADQFGDSPHLVDFEYDYRAKEAHGKLTEDYRLAAKALFKPLPVMVSELWDAYLIDDTRDEDWRKKNKTYIDHFIKVVGDQIVVNVTMEMARAYRDQRHKDKAKSRTVQKEINLIKAVFKKGMRELGIAGANPFEGIKAVALGQDSTKRETLDTDEIKLAVTRCREKKDDIATIMLIALFTGCRVTEAAGLRKIDVTLKFRSNVKSKIPFFFFRAHDTRSVKTTNSEREVPIHPTLLPLIKAQLEREPTGDALFKRYNKRGKKTQGDAASAALNKRWKAIFPKKTITNHCFRHTLEDRLKDADVPQYRIDEILGHSQQSSGAQYGKGRALEKKLKDLNAALPFK